MKIEQSIATDYLRRSSFFALLSCMLMIVVAMTLAAAGYLFFSASQIAQNDLARPDPTPFQDQLLSKIAEVEALDTVIVPSTILDRIERLRDSSRDFADLVPEAGLRRSYTSLFYNRGDESEIDFNSSLHGDGRRNNYLIGLLAPLISIADPAPNVRFKISGRLLHEDRDALIYPLLSIEPGQTTIVGKLLLGAVDEDNALSAKLRDVKGEITENIEAIADFFNEEIELKNKSVLDNKQIISDLRKEIVEIKMVISFAQNFDIAQRYGAAGDVVTVSDQSGDGDLVIQLIQTNIVRFGPMIILLFFASLIINLLKYCIKMSSFYRSRADVMKLSENWIGRDNIITLNEILSPDGFDIGKQAQIPGAQIIELAKSLSRVGGTK